jgi:hypothetical protein
MKAAEFFRRYVTHNLALKLISLLLALGLWLAVTWGKLR